MASALGSSPTSLRPPASPPGRWRRRWHPGTRRARGSPGDPSGRVLGMAMDVDSTSLQRLLDLQSEDSAIARLEHQRATLPEAARLGEVNDQLAELSSDLEIADKQHDEIQ